MCDITGFVVAVITDNITAENIVRLFMEDVILKYGICAVVVVDDGSSFKGTFENMCTILDITYWPLSRGNHKGNSVEKFHRFLNKT